jgi:hypothetical protein
VDLGVGQVAVLTPTLNANFRPELGGRVGCGVKISCIDYFSYISDWGGCDQCKPISSLYFSLFPGIKSDFLIKV